VNCLREIQAIKRLCPHPNIISLEEVLFDPPSGRLALVFELLEGNLYELMKGKLSLANSGSSFVLLPPLQFTYEQTIPTKTDRRQHFDENMVKSFMRQIFTALDHMHAKGVFHRDIKVRPQALVPSIFLVLPIPSLTLAVPFSHCIPSPRTY
jgi:renal tumor antigen